MGTAASVGENGGGGGRGGGGGKVSPEGGEHGIEDGAENIEGGMKVSEQQSKDIAEIRYLIRRALGETMAKCR